MLMALDLSLNPLALDLSLNPPLSPNSFLSSDGLTWLYVQFFLPHLPHLNRSVTVPSCLDIWWSSIDSLVNLALSCLISSLAISYNESLYIIHQWTTNNASLSDARKNFFIKIYKKIHSKKFINKIIPNSIYKYVRFTHKNWPLNCNSLSNFRQPMINDP